MYANLYYFVFCAGCLWVNVFTKTWLLDFIGFMVMVHYLIATAATETVYLQLAGVLMMVYLFLNMVKRVLNEFA